MARLLLGEREDGGSDPVRIVRIGLAESAAGSSTYPGGFGDLVPLNSEVLSHVEDTGRIRIVSNSLHAEKGRVYLWKLRPDLVERLVEADEYRFGELILLKPVKALIGVRDLRSLPP